MNDNPKPEIDLSDLIDNFVGRKATKVAAGVTLYTKDGQTIGNGIVIRETKADSPEAQEYLDQNGHTLWLVETDFGNRTKLTYSEILDLFVLGRESSYAEWVEDRLEVIRRNVVENDDGTT